ncbi:sulfatase-like hydrolase/transferase, partial [bacterium]|nr:sulfatase-like hydrolase/transferase [bacterium]
NDGFKVEDKPLDVFAKYQDSDMNVLRQYYDEFILYVDREFKRLVDMLESLGQMENTILVLTSDHGETFERGIAMHDSNALYQP